MRFFAFFALAALLAACSQHHGVVRTYYIAADEVDWNYMPSGLDMMAMKPTGYAKLYAMRSLHGLGKIYRKAIYREYTDATFSQLKPRPPQDAYLGLLGPTIHAEVGDTIKIVFRNHGTHPYSMHPHGVTYDKASEGAAYYDGVAMSAKGGDRVVPGATFTYTWQVPESAGPGPADPSSIVWLYHSHVEERKDVNTGLIGAIVITRRGMARADGTPSDVDRELVEAFVAFDENDSWFMPANVKRFAPNPAKYDKLNASTYVDPQGFVDAVLGAGSVPINLRWTINGYQYADGPTAQMKRGDRVRWYVVTLGEGLNFHTPHWHGNTVLVGGQRTDVINIAPAQMVTADMVADNPGTWLLHCHVSEHMMGGMAARYQVLP